MSVPVDEGRVYGPVRVLGFSFTFGLVGRHFEHFAQLVAPAFQQWQQQIKIQPRARKN